MEISIIALAPEANDMQPHLKGAIPTEGDCNVIIQFNKYMISDADDKRVRKLMGGHVDCDGDVSRPMYMSETVSAAQARKIVNGFGNRVGVALIAQPGTGLVYSRAVTGYAYRACMAWVRQLSGG